MASRLEFTILASPVACGFRNLIIILFAIGFSAGAILASIKLYQHIFGNEFRVGGDTIFFIIVFVWWNILTSINLVVVTAKTIAKQILNVGGQVSWSRRIKTELIPGISEASEGLFNPLAGSAIYFVVFMGTIKSCTTTPWPWMFIPCNSLVTYGLIAVTACIFGGLLVILNRFLNSAKRLMVEP